jgi:protein gp37
MSDTLISWSDKVWNPTTGCDRVSPGCANCYAKHLAARYRRNPQMQRLGIYQKDGGRASGPGFGLTLRPEKLAEPLHWKKPARIFVNSMSDLFHEEVPDEYIDKVFAVMALCPQHTFQILTKRIERARDWLWQQRFGYVEGRAKAFLRGDNPEPVLVGKTLRWPMPNVLIGPTVENAAMAKKRLPVTNEIKILLGWRTMVSYEPALGPVDFEGWMPRSMKAEGGPLFVYKGAIDWLICGGESGAKRRPFNHEWARSALRAARAGGIPFFMKQDGAYRSEVYDSLPDDLKVREFPVVELARQGAEA